MIRFVTAVLCLLVLAVPSGAFRAEAQTTRPGPDRPHTIIGEVRVIPAFHSKFLRQDREIIVWLPPGYETNKSRHYPVLYMHDGQNLFDGATSFIPGHEWRVDENATALIASHTIEPLIVVGIYNTGMDRTDEYTPTRASLFGGRETGGQGDAYGRMLVEELKPYIDQHFKTKPDKMDTGLAGSSLGGLISMYIGTKYPNVFGKLGCMSSSAWWDHETLVQDVKNLPRKTGQRIWLDVGTAEGGNNSRVNAMAVDPNRRLHEALIAKGWKDGLDVKYVEAAGEPHNEDAWSKRIGPMLTFLFPAQTKN